MDIKKIYYIFVSSNFGYHIVILIYRLLGCRAWSLGYLEARTDAVVKCLGNRKTLGLFLGNKNLPDGYGNKFDERVVEYPWLVSRINSGDKYILDAGSILNFRFIIENNRLVGKKTVIANLNPENNCFYNEGVSYVYSDYADIRKTCFKNDLFDLIICSSVLEHVGMDNTHMYSKEKKFKEFKSNDYLLVIDELKRLLKKGGRLLLTFPYGEYEYKGWFQQFDSKMVDKIIKRFDGKLDIFYFKYTSRGWTASDKKSCDGCKYEGKINSNLHSVAASAVVCMELQKK